MHEKHFEDLPQRILQALWGAILFLIVGWAKKTAGWVWRKYQDEKTKPLIIYMRRLTATVILSGAVISGFISLTCLGYVIYNGKYHTEEIEFLVRQRLSDSLTIVRDSITISQLRDTISLYKE